MAGNVQPASSVQEIVNAVINNLSNLLRQENAVQTAASNADTKKRGISDFWTEPGLPNTTRIHKRHPASDFAVDSGIYQGCCEYCAANRVLVLKNWGILVMLQCKSQIPQSESLCVQ